MLPTKKLNQKSTDKNPSLTDYKRSGICMFVDFNSIGKTICDKPQLDFNRFSFSFSIRPGLHFKRYTRSHQKLKNTTFSPADRRTTGFSIMRIASSQIAPV